jgi:hypothetical protein
MRSRYTVAIIAVAILGTVAAGLGYSVTHHLEPKAVTLRSTLSGESIQQLVSRSGQCHESQSPGEPVAPDSAYCAEVFRAIEARPLQIVPVRPMEMTIPAPPKKSE